MRVRLGAVACIGWACFAMAWLAGTPATAEIAAGDLRCTIAGTFGKIVVSVRALNCVYYRPDGGAEFYIGSSDRFGVDVGGALARRVAFKVIVPRPQPEGALAGEFAGVGFGATLGAGIAADALVNGAGVALVPAKNSNIYGLDFNGGISVLRLRYAGAESARERRSGY